MRDRMRRAARAVPWLLPGLVAAAWIGPGLLSPRPARCEEPAEEVSGQVSWIDPEAHAFGLEVGDREMEFSVDAATAITRDGKKIALEDVQPGDWAAACAFRTEGERRVCLRLEIQTLSGEEGLE